MEFVKFDIFSVFLACNQVKSSLPGQIKFILGMCVPHDEYMNPIDFGADLGSILVKNGKLVKF